VKPTPARPPAQPVTATPKPSLPAQPAPPGERISVVTHYYSHLSVATLRLESGTLCLGDVIHIRGHTTDFSHHNRQVVVLRPKDWAPWIYLTKPEGELLRPIPAGSLNVETVRAGSDQR